MHIFKCFTAAALVAAALPGWASSGDAFFDHAIASAEELDSMRGGFTTTIGGTSFEVSFGIERAIFVNGEPVAAGRLTIPQLGLTQNGPRNTAEARGLQSFMPGSFTVLQNSLDNQALRQMTVINASVKALEAMAASRFGAALNQGILGSVR